MRLNLAAGLAAGMAELYTHVPPIQHRDLKSMNVLVAADWTAKVSDFGMARHRTETTLQSSAHAKGGTFRWAAPETFDGTFTEASDVYSCGVTLWELVTRQLPYGEMGDHQIMMAVYARQERPDTSLVPADCPPALAAAAERCWQHDAAARPAFKELAADLEALAGKTRGGAADCDADGKKYDVFLSHRQADAQDFCRHLYDLLTAKGYRVFLDRVDASKVGGSVALSFFSWMPVVLCTRFTNCFSRFLWSCFLCGSCTSWMK